MEAKHNNMRLTEFQKVGVWCVRLCKQLRMRPTLTQLFSTLGFSLLDNTMYIVEVLRWNVGGASMFLKHMANTTPTHSLHHSLEGSSNPTNQWLAGVGPHPNRNPTFTLT